jgi:cytoskeletal protein CcmA (bactofilin family)
MFGPRNNKPASKIDTLIGAGSRIDGDVRFAGGLRVDGVVSGNIVSDDGGTLVLSEAAVVEGEVRVAHAVINGQITGPVHASDSLELQAKARISGDVHYSTIEVHLGAVIDGRLIHAESPAGAQKVVPLVSKSAD